MKFKFVSLCAFFLIMSGCSEKEEAPKEIAQEVEFVKQEPRKSRLLIPDTSRIVRLKDFDPQDSVLVAARAFNRAEREFIKNWNYNKNRKLFVKVVEHICREFRQCPSMKDSVAYQKEVYFILDSLMRNNILDSLIDVRKKELENSCFRGNKFYTKPCHEKINKEIYERVMKRMKEGK